ncbi:MAG: DNA cytosine methyltransferase [Armatimonadetes bacterium]|nr:DNA cytosine methyltransferase [Armatimonadota bacterium]
MSLTANEVSADSAFTQCPRQRLNVLALFAGVGGIEQGLESAGHHTVGAYEIDEAAKVVLRHRFPLVSVHDNILSLKRIDSAIDLVTAGFPCVDLSQAGPMVGLDGKSSGLIRHVLQVVASSEVKNLLLENVPFMLRLGKGAAMKEITEALEHAGFRWAYRTIDARSFGIPQRRPRVILYASRERDPRSVMFRDFAAESRNERKPVVGMNTIGFYSTEGNTGSGLVCDAIPPLKPGSRLGIKSSPAILLPSGEVGTPTIADAERLQGFEPGWTERAEGLGRNARWRLVGNAVNVRMSAWIGEGLATSSSTESPEVDGVPVVDGSWPTAAWNVGSGRFGVNLPTHVDLEPLTPLEQFLTEPLVPLSFRACDGFVTRAENSSLRFPPGFLDALRSYRESIT